MSLLRIIAAALLLPLPVWSAEIPPELWDHPRSAETVMAQPAVRQAVTAYQARASAQIVITHGVRQIAQLQAEELRAWLVALAVESTRLKLSVDPAVKSIHIEVRE